MKKSDIFILLFFIFCGLALREKKVVKEKENVVCNREYQWRVADNGSGNYAYADIGCGTLIMNKRRTGSYVTFKQRP